MAPSYLALFLILGPPPNWRCCGQPSNRHRYILQTSDLTLLLRVTLAAKTPRRSLNEGVLVCSPARKSFPRPDLRRSMPYNMNVQKFQREFRPAEVSVHKNNRSFSYQRTLQNLLSGFSYVELRAARTGRCRRSSLRASPRRASLQVSGQIAACTAMSGPEAVGCSLGTRRRRLSALLVEEWAELTRGPFQSNKKDRLGGLLRLGSRDSNPNLLIQSQLSYH
jgi:hypothetical protein